MVGQRIHDFRVSRKMSQEALAYASELHPAYLGSVERGEKCPSVETIYKISTGLNVPLPELLDIDSGTDPSDTEAIRRVISAMAKLTGEQADMVADIVERMLEINKQ